MLEESADSLGSGTEFHQCKVPRCFTFVLMWVALEIAMIFLRELSHSSVCTG